MPTLLNLPASTVLPSGQSVSQNFNFPASLSSVTTQFTVQPPDLTDSTITMDFELRRETFAGSGVFVFDHGFTWKGNSLAPKPPHDPVSPSITVATGPLSGVACQLSITLNKNLHTAILVTGN